MASASPEAGIIEARPTAVSGPARFIPTYKSQWLSTSAIADLPTRPGSMKKPTYFALTPQSITDFDWLAVLDSTAYNRGGQQWMLRFLRNARRIRNNNIKGDSISLDYSICWRKLYMLLMKTSFHEQGRLSFRFENAGKKL